MYAPEAPVVSEVLIDMAVLIIADLHVQSGTPFR